MKLKCLVIDDDPMITDLLQHFCSKIDQIEICVTCNNPADGLTMLSSKSYDLLFLDLNMPLLDGKGILDLKKDASKVIMITSSTTFAVDSYSYEDVIDYLLKPLSFERFYKSIQNFQVRMKSMQMDQSPADEKTIFLKDGNKWIQVTLADIKYIKSESNYATIYVNTSQIMSLKNLKDLEEELPSYFFRTHRSFIVNSKKIDFISVNDVSVDGNLIPVSQKYKEGIMKLLN